MSQSKTLAVIAGAVTMFVMGFLIYGLALASFFETNAGSATGVMREAPVFWALGVGNIAMAVLLTYIFSTWASISTSAGGSKAGALIGLLMALSFDFIMLGTTNILTETAMAADGVSSAVILGVGGAVIGAMLGRKQGPERLKPLQPG